MVWRFWRRQSTPPLPDKAAAAQADPVAAEHEFPELAAGWRAGVLRPWRLTVALNHVQADGDWVDIACDAREPEVDMWEAGVLYPSWSNIVRLSALTGTALSELLRDDDQGIQLPYARCVPALAATQFRRRYLPELVSLTVAAHPDSAPIEIARQIAADHLRASIGQPPAE